MNWKVLTQYPDPDLREKWDAFLADAINPTHYTTPNFFVDPYVRGGEKFSVLTFDNSRRVTAVLTGIDSGKRIQCGLPTRPQLTLRRNIADKEEVAKALLGGLREQGGPDLGVISLFSWEELSDLESLGFRMQRSDAENSTVLLDLSKSSEEIFNGFSQTRRNELRKAIKQNLVEIKELETETELRELYDIHSDWNHRKGKVPDTFENMNLAVEQKDHRKVFIAKYSGRVIAGSFYRFCKGGLVEYAANNSLVEFQKFRPNDLIGWHAIQWACEQKFPTLSMGGSHLFLRRFGGEIFSSYNYRLDQTFWKRYDRQAQLEKIAKKVYLSLPNSVRQKLKQVRGRS